MSDDPIQAQPAPPGESTFDQSEIDAMMAGANGGGDAPAAGAGDAAVAATEKEDAGESGAISQADIDALMGGTDNASGGDAAEASSAGDPDAVSQADIDALVSGASAGDADSGAAAPTDDAAGTAAPDDRVDSMGRPFDEMAAMMQAAIDEEKAEVVNAPPPPPAPVAPPPPGSAPPDLPSFDAAIAGIDPNRVTMLNDVKLRVKIELGRARMLVEDVLKLGEGAVVELDKLAGDPVDVYVNDRLVARGEVLVLNDNFCVRISDVISNDPHRVTA